MLTKEQIDSFYAEKRFAMIGLSRDPKKFSGAIFKELSEKGFEILPVNPNTDNINGKKCYKTISDLPDDVKRALVVTPKAQTAEVVSQLIEKGIDNIWLQQGAHTPEAEEIARKAGVNLISNQCIFMFSEPVQGIHKFHRFLWRMFGIVPK